MSLEEIAAEIGTCVACPLHRARKNVVPGEGNPRAEVLFLGEGPGVVEDQTGRPFVGPAGRLLEQLLKSIGFSREQVFITNTVKCRPPANRDPEQAEKQTCSDLYLRRQIALIDPKVIVLLGRHALNFFFPELRISVVHGREREFHGRVYLPLFHPAAALHQGNLRETLYQDFQVLRKILDRNSTEASGSSLASNQQSLF